MQWRESLNRYAFRRMLLLMPMLAACAPTQPTVRPPVPTAIAVSTLPLPPAAQPLSFTAAVYTDEANGFELDYPVGWSVVPDTQVGVRGSQALLLSPGTTAETIAEGGSRLSISIYQWDPKGDLEAYVAQRRTAWDASGFKVLDGSLTELSDGRPASDFFIEAPDGVLAYFLLTTNGEQYLQLAGEGDLTLLETIARTVRPLGFRPQ